MKNSHWLAMGFCLGAVSIASAEGFGTPTVDGILDGVYGGAEASDPVDAPQGNAPMDLLDLYVCNDNDFWYFYFTVGDDISAADWGKYLLYIDTTGDGSGATFDAWGRNVIAVIPHLPEFSLNSWVDGGGTYGPSKTQLQSWDGAAWGLLSTATDAALAAGAVSAIEWKVAKADLGSPATLWCEVLSTGGGESDNVQDTSNDPADDWNATDWATQSIVFNSTRVDEQSGSDTAPPVVVGATTLGQDPITEIEVTFSEAVSAATAENTANYSVSTVVPLARGGFSVTSAVLQVDPSKVVLTLDAALGYGVAYSTEVTGVQDLAGNPIVDDNATNIDCFKLFDLLFRVRMNLYLRDNATGTDTVGVEGSLSPLTWDPTCDNLIFDADADSVYEDRYQFTLGADCATGLVPEGSALDYKLTHNCITWESTDNHFYAFDDAAGIDTLEVWWQDEAPVDFTTIPVDVIFMVTMDELEFPPSAADTVGVAGSELPLDWVLPKMNLADDGVAPDDLAGDDIYSARLTFPAGSFKFLQYKFAINSDFECAGGGDNRTLTIDDIEHNSTDNPQIIGLEYYDFCMPVASIPTSPTTTSRLQFAISPNPLSSNTELRFTVPETAPVAIDLFDTSGRRIRSLVREILDAGEHSFGFDGQGRGGRDLAPGVYFVRLTVGDLTATNAVTILR